MKKKGFISAGMIYTLLVVFLVLTFSTLNTMQNKKTVLDNLKEETVDALYCNQNVVNDLKSQIKELQSTIVEKNGEIENLKNKGDATASQILSGKKAMVNGQEVIGTMKNINGNISAKNVFVTAELTKFQIATPGYYDTSDYLYVGNSELATTAGLTAAKLLKGQTVLGVTGTATSDANATSGNILNGKTAYVNGSKITGTMASLGAKTYTPGTSNQTIASGQYLSGTQTIKGDSNLVAGNIRKGITLFGITGTYESEVTEDKKADIAADVIGNLTISTLKTGSLSGSHSIGFNYSKPDQYVSATKNCGTSNVYTNGTNATQLLTLSVSCPQRGDNSGRSGYNNIQAQCSASPYYLDAKGNKISITSSDQIIKLSASQSIYIPYSVTVTYNSGSASINQGAGLSGTAYVNYTMKQYTY